MNMSDANQVFFAKADGSSSSAMSEIISLFTSMEEQLGLSSLSSTEKANFVILFSGIVQKRLAQKIKILTSKLSMEDYQKLLREEVFGLVSEVMEK